MQRTVPEIKLSIRPENQTSKLLNLSNGLFNYLSDHFKFHLTLKEQAALLRTSKQTKHLLSELIHPLHLHIAAELFANDSSIQQFENELKKIDKSIKEDKAEYTRLSKPNRSFIFLELVGLSVLAVSFYLLDRHDRRRNDAMWDLDLIVPAGTSHSCRELVVDYDNSCDDRRKINNRTIINMCMQLCKEVTSDDWWLLPLFIGIILVLGAGIVFPPYCQSESFGLQQQKNVVESEMNKRKKFLCSNKHHHCFLPFLCKFPCTD